MNLGSSVLDSGTIDQTQLTNALNTVSFFVANAANFNFSGPVEVKLQNIDWQTDPSIYIGNGDPTNVPMMIYNSSAGTVSFGDTAVTQTQLNNTKNGWTTTYTLPVSLTTFFNSPNWQNYVRVAYYLGGIYAATYAPTTQADFDNGNAATTGLLYHYGSNFSTIGGTTTLDLKTTSPLTKEINNQVFAVNTSINSAGQTTLTVNAKRVGTGTADAVMQFTLDLRQWSKDTGLNIPRQTIDNSAVTAASAAVIRAKAVMDSAATARTLNPTSDNLAIYANASAAYSNTLAASTAATNAYNSAVSAANSITVTAGPTGADLSDLSGQPVSWTTNFGNGYSVNTSSFSPSESTDFSGPATNGLATLKYGVQSPVPAVNIANLDRTISQGNNTISGHLDSAAWSAAIGTSDPGDLFKIVVTDITTGNSAGGTINSVNNPSGSWSVSFKNNNGVATANQDFNKGDVLVAQVQRVNSKTGFTTVGTLGYLTPTSQNNGIPAGQTPFVNFDPAAVSAGSNKLIGTITNITSLGTSQSAADGNKMTSLPAPEDINAYMVQVTIYNSDGSQSFTTATQAKPDGTWSTQVPSLSPGQFVEAVTRVQNSTVTENGVVRPTGTAVNGLNTVVSGND